MRKPPSAVSVCSGVTLPEQASFPISIPTNQSFTQDWNKWIYKKVSRHFIRNKDRIPDSVQNICLRILTKDAIGRWFYKHLTDELVDRPEAERILGGVKLTFTSQVIPVWGKRSDPNSLWRIRDLLTFAKFDYERYYYSIQGHTIDTEKVLRLLGYGSQDSEGKWVFSPSDLSSLESLYRQGKLRPSELTEHTCLFKDDKPTPSNGLCSEPGCGKKHFSKGFCTLHYSRVRAKTKCPTCDQGRQSLMSRGLSLTHRWAQEPSRTNAMKLRWNDSQLKGFLRNWRRQNMVRETPRHIMRSSKNYGIDAGLLRYIEMIIDNAVVNEFKTLTRSDDFQNISFNKGKSPEQSDSETIAWDTPEGSGEEPQRIIRDSRSMNAYSSIENQLDTAKLFDMSDLTSEEYQIVTKVDFSEQTIREYATKVGKSIQQVHKVRNSALAKLRLADESSLTSIKIQELLEAICDRHSTSEEEVFGDAVFGKPVKARTEFFMALSSLGMSPKSISDRFGVSIDRVESAILRASKRIESSLQKE